MGFFAVVVVVGEEGEMKSENTEYVLGENARKGKGGSWVGPPARIEMIIKLLLLLLLGVGLHGCAVLTMPEVLSTAR